MLNQGTKVEFEIPALKQGQVVLHIPKFKNRTPYVQGFLSLHDDAYQLRIGSFVNYPTDSYLVEVQSSCKVCLPALYHLPEEELKIIE